MGARGDPNDPARFGAVIAAVLGDAWPKGSPAHAASYVRTYAPLVADFRVEPAAAWARCQARGLVGDETSPPTLAKIFARLLTDDEGSTP